MEAIAIVLPAVGSAMAVDLCVLQEADRQLTEAVTSLQKSSMKVGWYGRIVKLSNGFEALGYADEKAYRAAKGVGRSTWYRMVRIAEDFRDLDRDQFLRMTAENAEHLARLPLEDRYTGGTMVKDQIVRWIDLAATMNEEQFQKALLEAQAAAADVPVAEMPVTFKMRVFEGQRPVIIATIDAFQKEHSMKTPGEALEAICVEVQGRKSFASFMQDALPRLRGAMRLTQDVEPESAISALRDVLEQHIMDMAYTLEQTVGQERWQQ